MDWISVANRLPESHTDVLCYFSRCKQIEISVLLYNGEFLYEDSMGEVTHWMPLPAPPEVKK